MAQVRNLSYEPVANNDDVNILSVNRINNVEIQAGYKRNGVEMTFFEWSVDTTITTGPQNPTGPNSYDFAYSTNVNQLPTSVNVGWGDGTRQWAATPLAGNQVVIQKDYAVGGAYTKLRAITDGRGYFEGANRNLSNDGSKVTDVTHWSGAGNKGWSYFFYYSPIVTWSANDEPDWSLWTIQGPAMFGQMVNMNEPKLLNWTPQIPTGNYDAWLFNNDSLTQNIAPAWNLSDTGNGYTLRYLFQSAANPPPWNGGGSPTNVFRMYFQSGISDADVETMLVFWNNTSPVSQNVNAEECFATTQGAPRTMSQTTYAAGKAAYDNLQNVHGWNMTNSITWV